MYSTLYRWANSLHMVELVARVKHGLVPEAFKAEVLMRRLQAIIRRRWNKKVEPGSERESRCANCRRLRIR